MSFSEKSFFFCCSDMAESYVNQDDDVEEKV